MGKYLVLWQLDGSRIPVDPVERNDLSFLFVVEMNYQGIWRIHLHPVRIENFQVRQAKGSEVAFLQKTMTAKCAAFGSKVDFKNGIGTIRVS